MDKRIVEKSHKREMSNSYKGTLIIERPRLRRGRGRIGVEREKGRGNITYNDFRQK